MASAQGKNNKLLKKIYKALKMPQDSTYLQDIVDIANNKVPYVPPILGQVQIWVHKRVRVKFRVRVQVPKYGSGLGKEAKITKIFKMTIFFS